MHYPGHLRDSFVAALEDYLAGNAASDVEGFFHDEATQQMWNDMDASGRLQWAAGKLWRCTDIMPGDVCRDLDMQAGSTYAQAARRVRQGILAPPAAL